MAKRFVSIWFPYLATDWFCLKEPTLKNTALVLQAPVRGCATITAANKQAQAQGVVVGMTLADAKALFPQLRIKNDKPGLTAQLLARIAEWCIRFTPVAAINLPEGIVLDASGCAHLWGSEEAYLSDITNRLAARGYTTRMAMADTVGAAWAMARFGKEPFIVESGKQNQALLPLPPAALRLSYNTVVRLQKLGLRQVKDFISMPRTALRRRFGANFLQRLAQALGEEEEAVTPVYPPEPYQERLPCIEPIVTLTGIEIALQHLLQALCNRLHKEGKGLRTAYFRCYLVDGGAQGIEIGTSRASHGQAHLFELFSLKLSTICPNEGIELFVLEATSVEGHAPAQESLWEVNGSTTNAQLSELVDRLAGKVGWEAISRYLPAEHWWPERSFLKTSSLIQNNDVEWNTYRRRPLQVMPQPQKIEVTAPIPDYPPMLFRYKGQLHKIVKADGPERIEQEWWIQEGEHRDYYCVEDEEGCRYWLFRLGHYNEEKTHQWFLHGFFA